MEEPPLDRRPPAPKTRREERRARRIAEREADRERVRRKAARPVWQDPTALITAAAVVVGLVLFVLLVVRPGSTNGAPTSSGNPLGLVKPNLSIPAGMADGRTLGKADAPVTLEVYTDFQCPYCGQFATLVEPQLISNQVASGTLRIIARDYSFIGSGRNPDESTDAAVAARCADRQGHFWDYYATVFANQGSTENAGAFTRERLLAMADLLGLDHATFDTCLNDTTLRGAVVTETAAGTKAGVTSTPTSILNGQLIVGLKDYATMATLIAAAGPERHPGPERDPGVVRHRALAVGGEFDRAVSRRSGLAMTVLATVGLVVAAYLAATKLLGEAPACGPIRGCEDVAASPYSELFGIPVAVFGVGFSIVLLGLSLAWWRTADRRALLGAYGLGLLGTFAVAGLTYLELFVIHAICVYCVTFAITVVAGFAIAGASVRGSRSEP